MQNKHGQDHRGDDTPVDGRCQGPLDLSSIAGVEGHRNETQAGDEAGYLHRWKPRECRSFDCRPLVYNRIEPQVSARAGARTAKSLRKGDQPMAM